MVEGRHLVTGILYWALLIAIPCTSSFAGHAFVSLPGEGEVTVTMRIVQRTEPMVPINQSTFFLIEEKSDPMMAFRAFAKKGLVPPDYLGSLCQIRVKIHQRKDFREYEILKIEGLKSR